MQRPTIEETEEDLLKQQEEYLKSKNIKTDTKRPAFEPEIIDDRKKQKSLVGDIIEKNTPFESVSRPSNTGDSFPKSFKVDKSLFGSQREKKSIFALQLEKKKERKDSKKVSGVSKQMYKFPETSILSGPEHDSIHEENVEKISKMTEEEILREQKLLYESLDVNFIKYLKEKRSKLNMEDLKSNVEHMDSKTTTEVMEVVEESGVEVGSNPIVDELCKDFDKKWLNIGVLEKEKLEWVGDIPDVKSLEADKPYSARFDFKGFLLPFASEIDVRQSLHHHGEEPERPGYTIQELYQLSRSSVIQQRILALNTLANIIEKAKLGYYDKCFDGNLLQKLMDNDLFLLLRFSLDENIDSVIAATLKCLHSLMYNSVDEICLDKCLSLLDSPQQPVLNVPDIPDKTEEIKDHVIVSLDFIKGVIRTDILVRLNYILNNLSPTKDTIVYILEILIRIVRHSLDSCQQILCGDLIKTIYEKCLPFSTNPPVYQALKLFRIMASYSKDSASMIETNFSLVQHIIKYLEIDQHVQGLSKSELYKLQLECFYTWHIFMHYGIACDIFKSYTPNIIRFLNFYLEKVDFVESTTNFDFEHCTGLLNLISLYIKQRSTLDPNIYVYVNQICLKWMNQFLRYKYYKLSMLRSLGAIFQFYFNFFEVYGITDTSLSNIKTNINVLQQFLNSSLFNAILKDFGKHSVILTDNIISKRNPKNLPSLNTIYENGDNFIEIIQEKSTLYFLIPFLKYLLKISKIQNDFSIYLNIGLNNKHIVKYVKKIISVRTHNMSWFLRYEVFGLVTLLECFYFTKQNCLTLAFKVVNLLQNKNDLKRVFSIIFDANVWKTNSGLELVEYSLSDLKNILETYEKTLRVNDTDTSLCTEDVNVVLPVDWMFSPILQLQQSNTQQNTPQIIKHTLQFVYLMNTFELFSIKLSQTSKYCRLCCVFLLDTDSFRSTDIQTYLSENLKYIMLKKNELDFNEKVAGISSFYDFYTELVTQYAGVSYGDEIFAHYILIPLQNQHDNGLRKLIWFEYLHVLKVVTLHQVNKNYNLNLQDFVKPLETDQSLLTAYLNNIAMNVIQEIRNGFVYSVAKENVKCFLDNFEDKENSYYVLLLNKVKSLKNENLKQYLLS